MQFENSFVDNYVFHEDGDIISGGYPIQKLVLEPLDAKFDNMNIPTGLVMDNVSTKTAVGGGAHYHKSQNSDMEVIDDELFTKLFHNISYKPDHKSTRKNLRDKRNITKKH
jgi:hypothetical protein